MWPTVGRRRRWIQVVALAAAIGGWRKWRGSVGCCVLAAVADGVGSANGRRKWRKRSGGKRGKSVLGLQVCSNEMGEIDWLGVWSLLVGFEAGEEWSGWGRLALALCWWEGEGIVYGAASGAREKELKTALIFGGQKWRNDFWEGRNYGCWSAAGEGKMSRKKWPEGAKMAGEEEAWVRLVWVRKIQAEEEATVLEKMRGKGGGAAPWKEMGLGLGFSFFKIFFLMFQNCPLMNGLETLIYSKKYC